MCVCAYLTLSFVLLTFRHTIIECLIPRYIPLKVNIIKLKGQMLQMSVQKTLVKGGAFRFM